MASGWAFFFVCLCFFLSSDDETKFLEPRGEVDFLFGGGEGKLPREILRAEGSFSDFGELFELSATKIGSDS